MADNKPKSREIIGTIEDVNGTRWSVVHTVLDGVWAESTNGLVEKFIPYNQIVKDDFKPNDPRDKRDVGGQITVKFDVDVSEALTGLKALQREAKEATKALRELEAAIRNAE